LHGYAKLGADFLADSPNFSFHALKRRVYMVKKAFHTLVTRVESLGKNCFTG
jgi:hypothetical protein